MILHLVHDDKFIDAAYRIFEEVYPGNNDFLLIAENNKLNYINKTPVKVISPVRLLDKKFIKSLSQYDMVIVHWMDRIKAKLISRASKNIKFVWVGWGADYYPLITGGDRQKLLGPLTNKLFIKNMSSKQGVLTFWIKSFLQKILFNKGFLRKTVDRINYFCPVLREDFDLVQDSFDNFYPKYLAWNYGTLEDDLIRGTDENKLSSNNILVGNSATYANNHLEVIELLSSVSLGEKKVLVPLSYGDTLYREKIIDKGLEKLGDNFKPIVEFIPIDDYVALIGSCSIVIMNHYRQQSLGNIVIMMYLGAKVFLNKQNPIYDFFKKQGAHIYLVDDVATDKALIDSRLTATEIEQNRRILEKHWSRTAIHLKTKQLVETVKSDMRTDKLSGFGSA